MALWGFGQESTQVASGANTEAGMKAGFRPLPTSSGIGHSYDGQSGGIDTANKRNVIVTSKGWVRRTNRVSDGNVQRQFDEVLVAANPGSGRDYSSNTYMGRPDICEIFVKLNANGVISANASGANLYIVFNTPIHKRPSGNLMSITIANTVGGNNAVARITAASAARANVANNVMVFTMPLLQGGAGSAKATYKINAQTISVTGNPLYNPDYGVTTTANLQISGAVSNNLARFNGTRITSFQVSPKGI
jgi:hypothetical protein